MPFSSSIRLAATVFAGALVGLAFVAPAAARSTEPTATLTVQVACIDLGWWATWKLTTADTNGAEGVLSDVDSTADSRTFVDGAMVTADGNLTESQRFESDVTSATLKFSVTWNDGDDTHTEKVRARAQAPVLDPDHCAVSSIPPDSGAPSLINDQDCTTMTVGVSNPEDNDDAVTLRLETSTGEERTLVAEPGEKKSEKFSAIPGFSVTTTLDDEASQTIPYRQPAECTADGNAGGDAADDEDATGGAGDAAAGDGGGLPVTGAAAGTFAGGAALLLALGAALFLVARRRRVKFTA